MQIERRPDLDMTLDIFIYRENELWVAHCIQLDIVGTDKENPSKALEEAIDLCESQIDYATDTGNVEHLFKAAPIEIVKAFRRARHGEEYGNPPSRSVFRGANVIVGPENADLILRHAAAHSLLSADRPGAELDLRGRGRSAGGDTLPGDLRWELKTIKF
jgi:hypothetical protein